MEIGTWSSDDFPQMFAWLDVSLTGGLEHGEMGMGTWSMKNGNRNMKYVELYHRVMYGNLNV